MNIPPWGWRANGAFDPCALGPQPPTHHAVGQCPYPRTGCTMCPQLLYPLPPQPTFCVDPGCNQGVPDPCANAGKNLKGRLRAGMEVLFHSKNTTIMVPIPTVKLWEGPHRDFGFKIYTVGCNWSAQDVIEELGGDENSSITEVFERGDGQWTKGLTMKYKDARAKERISKRGWTEARGTTREPVWVVVHT